MGHESSPEFLIFLQKRVETARADFLEARRRLEEFEQQWGMLVYSGESEFQDQLLGDRAHIAYEDYKKAWVEWYAAVNGYSTRRQLIQKDTSAFAAREPSRILIQRIERDAGSITKN